ncbi:MAG: hypothetical protein LBL48_12260 [Azoarcus sp.]|nr:hypothetical protein [Azoarcus sp.]
MTMFFILIVLAALWLAVVWLALPVDLAALALPSLVSLHVAPPALAVLSGLMCKRMWQWNTARLEKARAGELAAQETTRLTAEAAAREAELARRRAFLDCRAAWLAVPGKPGWFMDELPQCRILEQDANTLRESGRKAALSSSLREVFDAALAQCEAFAFLPLYLSQACRHDELELVRKAWQEALREAFPDGKDAPSPDCRRLPDADEPLSDRVLALFENDPAMPAMWLVGMDSLLEEGIEDESKTGIEPGHAVAALVLSRPNLVLVEADAIEKPDMSDPYIPHWERGQGGRDAPQWGSVPPGLRARLWALPPFARLHRSRASFLQINPARIVTGARQLRKSIDAALMDAALRDPPPLGGCKADEPEPLELGYLIHNCGSDDDPVASKRLVSVTSALRGFDCRMDLEMTGNVFAEHGDTGAACPVLMLAEAAMCAAFMQLPVMLAESEGADRMCIGIVRPAAG